MAWTGLPFVLLGVFVVLLGPTAAGESPRVRRMAHSLKQDDRVVRDRLYARNNQDRQDYSFLNAVGAVWPAEVANSAAGYMASSGFLIDRCHVLTNLHAVYIDDLVVDAPIGKYVSFAVGQTDSGASRGALQGMKYLLGGVVVAHGDTLIVDHRVHNPENDWALIRLSSNVDDTIKPMTIATVDTGLLTGNRRLSIAGFPADRRAGRSDRFGLKDLWGSEGEVVRVVWASTVGAVIESTIQATRGNSGGPLYGDFYGLQHIVLGMHQGIRGNGIDVSEDLPNVQIFFTPATLTSIRTAQAQTPCS